MVRDDRHRRPQGARARARRQVYLDLKVRRARSSWRARRGPARPARDRVSRRPTTLRAMDDAVRFDERRPRPVRGAGLAHGRGADARLHERARRCERTRETGEMHFWSRSRDELWHKGETSGNVQRLRALRYDCDARRAARARRAGRPRLPHRRAHLLLPTVERRAGRAARGAAGARADARASARRERPEGSYTAELLDDPPRIGDKVREEAEEVARAAREESDERVAEEAADVLYHLDVLLRSPRAVARRRAARCSMAVAAEARRPAVDADASSEARELAREHNLDPAAPHASSTTARRRSRRS